MNKRILLLILLTGYLPLHAQTCAAYVGGYIPSYRNPGTVDYTKLTDVFYAFAKTNASGDIIVDDPTTFNTFKTASTGKQRYISVGGGGDNTFPGMAASLSARQAFANNCVTFCQAHALQGVDMDWELIRTTQDSANFGALMRELKSALHEHDLKLIATIGYGSFSGDYYNVGALKEADWIQLMVYDQTGTWAESPYGNHATYQHMLDAITYWTDRGYTNLSTIVIGLPFYGYRFNSLQGGIATAITYKEIESTYPWLSCDRDEIDLVVWNSPETIRHKVRYVIDNGLKGVMIWEMGQDLSSDKEKSLLNAVSQAACDLPAACNTFITGISKEDPEQSIRLFPVPVTNTLSISIDQSASKIAKIELINNLGQILFTKKIPFAEELRTINVSDFPAGIYFVKFNFHNGINILKRVIKN